MGFGCCLVPGFMETLNICENVRSVELSSKGIVV